MLLSKIGTFKGKILDCVLRTYDESARLCTSGSKVPEI
jgi:hypothetical protein